MENETDNKLEKCNLSLNDLVNMILQKECVVSVSMNGSRFITIPESLLRSPKQGPAA